MGSKRFRNPIAWPSWLLLTVGVSALCLDLAIVINAVMAGLDEPFPNFETYIGKSFDMTPLTVVSFFPFMIILIGVGALTLAGFRSVWKLFAVESMRWTVPLAVWGIAYMINQVTDPSLGLATPAPAWTSSIFFAVLGAPSWLLIFMYFAVRNVYGELRRMQQTTAQSAVDEAVTVMAMESQATSPQPGVQLARF